MMDISESIPKDTNVPVPVRPKLDKRNYMFVKMDSQELIKNPGEIAGQAFKLENLEDCTIWLLDHIAQVLFYYI